MNNFCTNLVTHCRTWCYVLSVCLLSGSVELQAFQARVIHFAPKTPAQQASSASKFTVSGAVHKAGCYQVEGTPDWTLQSVLDHAGGLTSQASPKIKIVRGDRASLVVMYPSQKDFKILPGDVVIAERGMKSSARVISHQELSGSNSASHASHTADRANHQQEESRGHVVLLGVSSDPVVMPLWMPGLTTETLLTTYLKQEPQVSAGTRILAGRPAGAKGELQDGMVLSVPAHLVNQQTLPPLPETIFSRQVSRNSSPEFSRSPIPETSSSSAAPGEELRMIPPVLSQPPVSPEPAQRKEERKPVERQSTSVENSARPLISDQPESMPTQQQHNQQAPQLPVSEPLAMLPEGAFSLSPVLPQELDETTPLPVPVENLPEENVQEKIIDYSAQLKLRSQGKSVPAVPQEELQIPATATNTPRPEEPSPYVRALEQGLRPFDEMLDETLRSSGPLSSADQVVRSLPEEEVFWKPEQPREIPHLALTDEIVPPPQEPAPARTPALFGVVAALLVVVGALMVLLNAFRNHFSEDDSEDQPSSSQAEEKKTQQRFAQTLSEEQSAESAPVQPVSARPVQDRSSQNESSTEIEAPHTSRRSFSDRQNQAFSSETLSESPADHQPGSEPELPAEPQVQVSKTSPSRNSFVSEPVFEAQVSPVEQKNSAPASSPLGLIDLPVQEERLQLTHGLQFFGKPQQHYEFRIDARHEIPRPHMLPKGASLSSRTQPASSENPGKKTESRSEPVLESPQFSASEQQEQPEELGAGLFASAYARLRAEVSAGRQNRQTLK